MADSTASVLEDDDERCVRLNIPAAQLRGRDPKMADGIINAARKNKIAIKHGQLAGANTDDAREILEVIDDINSAAESLKKDVAVSYKAGFQNPAYWRRRKERKEDLGKQLRGLVTELDIRNRFGDRLGRSSKPPPRLIATKRELTQHPAHVEPLPVFNGTTILKALRSGTRLDEIAQEVTLDPHKAVLIIDPLLRRVAASPDDTYDPILLNTIAHCPEILTPKRIGAFSLLSDIQTLGNWPRHKTTQAFTLHMLLAQPEYAHEANAIIAAGEEALADILQSRRRYSVASLKATIGKAVNINLFQMEKPLHTPDPNRPKRSRRGSRASILAAE